MANGYRPLHPFRQVGDQVVRMHGHTWYFRLVPTKPEPGKRPFSSSRSLLKDHPDVAGHLVVCYTPEYLPGQSTPFINKKGNQGRLYGYFDSYVDFIPIMQAVSPERRYFYEAISGRAAQKPHFDIDIKSGSATFGQKIVDAVLDGCAAVFASVNKVLNPKTDILLYSSHSGAELQNLPDPNPAVEGKKSFHLILNNWAHSSNEEASNFYKKVMEQVAIACPEAIAPSGTEPYIDPKVYGPHQLFRLLGSQKPGSNRPKIYNPDFYWRKTLYSHQPLEDTVQCTFYESLVSYTTECQILPAFTATKTQMTNGNDPTDFVDLSPALVDECLRLMVSKLEDAPFDVREVKGRLIVLDRTRPSYCSICGRTHEADNAFLFVSNGRVYWKCWRQEEQKSLLVGYLALSVEDLRAGLDPLGVSSLGDSGEVSTTTINKEDDFFFGNFDMKLWEAREEIPVINAPIANTSTLILATPKPQSTNGLRPSTPFKVPVTRSQQSTPRQAQPRLPTPIKIERSESTPVERLSALQEQIIATKEVPKEGLTSVPFFPEIQMIPPPIIIVGIPTFKDQPLLIPAVSTTKPTLDVDFTARMASGL